MEFDITLTGTNADTGMHGIVRFQNNIQSIFQRLRVLYGSTPLEDIMNYNVIVRALTEWTATDQMSTMDQTSVAEGIGGVVPVSTGTGSPVTALQNTRQTYIHGTDNSVGALTSGNVPSRAVAAGATNGAQVTRRYQVNIAAGLFTQDKLIPTKFMASQFALEFTLATEAQCMISFVKTLTGDTTATGSPTYSLTNANIVAEVLEFDASYDAMFALGLKNGGVPLKYSTWNTYFFSIGGSASLNLQIQERSRSVKALFAVQRRFPEVIYTDSHAFFFESGGGTMQTFQYRIGAKYYPAQPVTLNTTTSTPNGGAEAIVELQKALNVVGDYRLSTGINTLRWALPRATASVDYVNTIAGQEADFATTVTGFSSTGVPTFSVPQYPIAGNVGSSCFTAAIDLETSNGIQGLKIGVEISGLNAEEQSDISLSVVYSATQADVYILEFYAFVDKMVILGENNTMVLVE